MEEVGHGSVATHVVAGPFDLSVVLPVARSGVVFVPGVQDVFARKHETEGEEQLGVQDDDGPKSDVADSSGHDLEAVTLGDPSPMSIR